MDLLIDIGNSNAKWALRRNGVLGRASSVSHRAAGLQELADEWRHLTVPDRILAANVAGAGTGTAVAELTVRLWGRKPEFVSTRKSALGVTVAYAQPERLGVDRWLALIAAYHHHPCPALVVDCGTAITLDAIDATGRHMGGLILPGLRLMWSSLMEHTRIPPVEYREFDGLLGSDTVQCISAGAKQAVTGMIERLWRRFKDRYGWEATVVVSGSDGDDIAGEVRLPTQYTPDLVLQGLALLSG